MCFSDVEDEDDDDEDGGGGVVVVSRCYEAAPLARPVVSEPERQPHLRLPLHVPQMEMKPHPVSTSPQI